jgi:[ribosomal protein S5]-alanine N-acetyltransferase
MPSLDTFSTSRLRAERLTPEHRSEIARMHRDPAVMATLGGLRDDAQTEAYLARNLKHWDEYGFGLWIVRDATNDRVAGRAVVRHLLLEGTDEVEVGYGFYQEWWGRGLATEVARACVDLGYQRLGLPSLVALTLPTNLRSHRVLTKVGLSFDREIDHEGSRIALFRSRNPSVVQA